MGPTLGWTLCPGEQEERRTASNIVTAELFIFMDFILKVYAGVFMIKIIVAGYNGVEFTGGFLEPFFPGRPCPCGPLHMDVGGLFLLAHQPDPEGPCGCQRTPARVPPSGAMDRGIPAE